MISPVLTLFAVKIYNEKYRKLDLSRINIRLNSLKNDIKEVNEPNFRSIMESQENLNNTLKIAILNSYTQISTLKDEKKEFLKKIDKLETKIDYFNKQYNILSNNNLQLRKELNELKGV